MSFDALTRGGYGQWQAARQLNQTASELAFHRNRVARGIKAADARPTRGRLSNGARGSTEKTAQQLSSAKQSSPILRRLTYTKRLPANHPNTSLFLELMRVQLLPSTFDSQGHATLEQRLTCFLIDESVAVDAGSIALALTTEQRQKVRDIIVTHPHMDHIASLPNFYR